MPTRRQVVAAISSIPIASMGSPGVGEPGTIERLKSVYVDESAARRVGEVFLETFPCTLLDVRQTLLRRLGMSEREVCSVAHAELSARARAIVSQDFAGGQTVTLNGWLMSSTEARFCALHSLTRQGSESPA